MTLFAKQEKRERELTESKSNSQFSLYDPLDEKKERTFSKQSVYSFQNELRIAFNCISVRRMEESLPAHDIISCYFNNITETTNLYD